MEGYYNLYINSTYSYCYISYEGFYFDKNDLFYKRCYSTCKSCKGKGDELKHNCIKCKNQYPFEKIVSNYKNRYNTTTNETKINKVEQLIENLQFDLINDFNESLINEKFNMDMEKKKVIITLTTTYNEKNKSTKNETIINLGECENKLKEVYPIPYNDSLYILKIEVNETGMKIPKIEYEVYYPLNDNNLVKLNLSVCKNTNIEISIPAYIDDDIDKYNQSSPYYNDICSKTTSKFGTDICIKDRQNEFIDNNMVLCEKNCNLIDYDKNTQKAKCSCKIKLSLPLIEDVVIDKNQLYNSFTDINYFANINMMKCFNEVMKINELKNNIGFFILLTIIISYFVILLLFIFKYYQILKYEIFQIFSAKLNIKEEKKTILECKDTDDKVLKKKYEKGDILITYTKYVDEKKKNLKKEKNLLTEMKEIKRKKKLFGQKIQRKGKQKMFK